MIWAILKNLKYRGGPPGPRRGRRPEAVEAGPRSAAHSRSRIPARSRRKTAASSAPAACRPNRTRRPYTCRSFPRQRCFSIAVDIPAGGVEPGAGPSASPAPHGPQSGRRPQSSAWGGRRPLAARRIAKRRIAALRTGRYAA